MRIEAVDRAVGDRAALPFVRWIQRHTGASALTIFRTGWFGAMLAMLIRSRDNPVFFVLFLIAGLWCMWNAGRGTPGKETGDPLFRITLLFVIAYALINADWPFLVAAIFLLPAEYSVAWPNE